jgi:alkaline phosphatase D
MGAGAKPGSHDTWDGFPEEREEVFSWIDKNEIDGVVLLSADRHRSDARLIARPGGYALYDFMSSRLTNFHTHELIPGALFDYNDKCSFGLLTFDTSRADPQVIYSIVNIDGETIHSLTLARSKLSR